MTIRKGVKEDFEEYYKLKKEEEKDYSQIIQEKIPSLSKKEYKKDFDEIFSSRKNILLVMEENKKLLGFLYGTKQGNKRNIKSYIEVLFVSKDGRRKGIASSLIKEFIKILKQGKIKKIQLSVNTKNIGAIKLYEKLGFEIFKHEMRKKI